MYGIGKSNLAYCIGCKFGVPVINIDNFVGEVTESYKDVVAFEILKRPILRYKKNKRTFVIEGILLLDILNEFGVIPDIFIYYKLLNSRGEWVHEDLFNCIPEQCDVDSLPVLSREIAKYHMTFKPLDKADCIALRRGQ
jgi:hypothetical protein